MADGVVIRILGDDSHFQSTLNGAKKAASGFGKAFGTVFKGVAAVTGAAAAGIGAAGLATVNYTANIEQLQASFETMTGSASKAQSVIDRIRKLGAETPFEMPELAEVTQLLMNYGLQADNALDKMTMLGDIAQGNADKMKSIATAYGQMHSAGKVSLEDVKQMIEAGFNPLQIISEKTGESMASLYDRISKGTLAMSEITAAMEAATSVGGKYYQSMQKQSETINGMISTIKDNGQQLLGKVFEPVTDGLSETVLPGVISMMDEMDAAFEKNGFDGLSDALLAQVPKLTKAGVSGAKTVLSGVQKKLPGLAKGMLGTLPDLLGAAGELGPELLDTTFEVFETVIVGVGEQLPDLAPILIQGGGKMILSFGNGLLRMAVATIGSLDKMLVDILTTSTDEIWDSMVDKDLASEMKVALNADVDVGEAKSAIETAYDTLRTALNTDLLTDAQRAEIVNMIGEDYDAIKAKLIYFGLSEADAGALASQITSTSSTITAELSKLNVGVDGATLLKWIAQANGSRIHLKSTLKSAGLSDEDITEVIGVYEDMTGTLTGGLPSMVDEIYATLTDGKADDKSLLNELKDSAVGSALTEVQNWLDGEIAKLDASDANYDTKVAALTEQAATWRTEITTLDGEMQTLISELAGQPTAVVQARMEEFAALEQRANALAARLAEVTAQGESVAQRKFEMTASGATTDATNIATAQAYSAALREADIQKVEEEAKAAREKLDQAWLNGMSDAEHREIESQIDAWVVASMAGVEEAYSTRTSQIMSGIIQAFAASDVSYDQLPRLTELLNAQAIMNEVAAGVRSGNADPTAANEAIIDLLKKCFPDENWAFDDVLGKNVTTLSDAIGTEIALIFENLNVDEAGHDKLVTIIDTLLESGMLEGVENLDTMTIQDKLAYVLGNTFASVETESEPTVAVIPELKTDMDTETVQQEVADEVKTAVENAPAVQAEQKVEATTSVTTAAGDIQSDVTGEVESAAENAPVVPIETDVSVSVNVTNSNAAEVGAGLGDEIVGGIESKADSATSAGTGLGTSAASGARTAYGQMKSAGVYLGTGFQLGLASKRQSIINTARSIADSAARAIKATLQINSPSRLSFGYGEFFGEGFELGAVKSFRHAISSINSVVGSVNLGPQLNSPDFEGALTNATQAIYSAEEMRPIQLVLNGKVVGQVLSRSVQVATNISNRSIDIGYGGAGG